MAMKLPRVAALDLALALLLLVFLTGYYAVALQAPAVGLYHDEGVYLVTAKSLAEGNGYRIESLPGEPSQTKYPVLFPFLLALVWKLFPEFPGNLVFLRMVPLLFSLLWSALLFVYFKQESASTRTALWIVLLTAASPWVVFFSATLMAEIPFACFCTAALIALQRLERADGAANHKTALACGLLAAAAFLTRTVGVAILVAGVAGLLMRKRMAAVLLFSLVCLLLIAPWFGWQSAQPQDAAESFAYYSKANYQNWNVVLRFTFGQKISIVLLNLIYLALSTSALLGFWLVPTSLFFVLAFDVLILVGFLADLRDGIRPVHIFLVAYSGVILLWAWPPIRFLVPVLPFLLFFSYRGLVLAFKVIAWRETLPPALTGIVVVSLLANMCYVMVGAAGSTRAKGSVFFSITTGEGDEWKDLSPLLAWIRSNTAPEVVLQSNIDPVVYLYTGRKTIRGFVADPFELFYTSDPQQPLGPPSSLARRLIQHEVGYVIRTPSRAYKEGPFLNELVDALVAEHPQAFTLVYAGPNPDYRVYRVNGAALRRSLSASPE